MTVTHVAIIMDGNGRWAAKRGIDSIDGHKAGVEAAKKCIDYAIKQNIKFLTLYAFSFENWNRNHDWVLEILNLLKKFLIHDLFKLKQKNIKLKIIGDRKRFPKDIVDLFEKSEKESQNNDGIHVILALGYSGRNEILRSVKDLIQKDRASKIDLENLTFLKLDTDGIPDPDLLIRTSGHKRISNFLLWQIAYTELHFCEKLWPDFNEEDFIKAIEDYKGRKRTFGL